MKLLDVITPDEARAILFRQIHLDAETVTLDRAAGRIICRNASAPIDVPGFDRSTVDGYAVVSRDTSGAGESIPVFLDCVGEVAMGEEAAFSISSGQCAYLPTGAMLPAGADAVVMAEYCEAFGNAGIAIYRAACEGDNTVLRGDDMKAGKTVVKRGTRLRSEHIGALSALGMSYVNVYKGVRAAIISTGDELLRGGRGPAEPGKVFDINTPMLCAAAQSFGMEVTFSALVDDDERSLRDAVRKAAGLADIIAISGGSSKGRHDMTEKVINGVFHPGVVAHGIALKPGKPTIIACDDSTASVIIGLPGHPVAAAVVWRIIIERTLNELMGVPAPLPFSCVLMSNVVCDAGKVNFIPVTVKRTGDAASAAPIRGKSGLVSTLSGADGYILTGRNCEGLNRGETVSVYPLL